MKRITLLFIAILFMATIAIAQKTQSTTTKQLVSRLAQIGDSTGDVNAYFTKAEQLELKNYFANKQETKSSLSPKKGGGVNAYCIINGSREFGTFDIADASVVTPISASGVDYNSFENAGAIDPTNPTLAYVIGIFGDVFRVDITTGVYTFLGELSGGAAAQWVAAEFDQTTGILYGIRDRSLVMIDLNNFSYTTIGDPIIGTPISLAIDGNSIAYILDVSYDNIISIDITTGVKNILGPAGFDAKFSQGMFWDLESNSVYLTAFNFTFFDSELRSLNTETGETTFITQMDTLGASQYGWASTPGGIPTPIDLCGAYTSSPALVINDTDSTDVITVPATSRTISDLNITLDISHSQIGDLIITLTSPAGTSVDLLVNPCGNFNDLNIMLDDEGVTIVCADPTLGNFIPDNPLSAFDGEDFQGDWTLSILDDQNSGSGILNSWCLIPTFSCGKPTDIIVSNISYFAAYLGWTVGPDNEHRWDAEWGAVGFTPGTGTQEGMRHNTLDNPVFATGLSHSTDFELYVRAVCSNNSNSDWVGPLAFSTLAIDLLECGETFYDSGGAAGNYSNYENIITTITPDDSNEPVTVTFTYVDIETNLVSGGCSDFIYIADGPLGSNTLAQKLCGEKSGDGNEPTDPENLLNIGDSFTSTHASGALTFYFQSNSQTTETGWKADITCGSTVSITHLVEAVGFNYYPNPVSNELFLTAKENITNVKIFNMLGQVVISTEPSSIETTINMSNLANGPYFVKAQIGNTVGTFKVVKK